MDYQNTFKRYEIKYLITPEQKESVLQAISPYMKLDKYGKSTICNIYFDTDSFRLIRRSLEKPVYKEKLRLRSYGTATPDSEVFAELKKKYRSVVYKRRLTLPENDAMQALLNGRPLPVKSQIGEEIEYFRQYYGPLEPKVFLSYEREAYYTIRKSDFRITFDQNILYRTDNLYLTVPPDGIAILPQGLSLMEIKTSGAIPIWLTEVLSQNRIFKTSFSKYGNAYLDIQRRNKNA